MFFGLFMFGLNCCGAWFWVDSCLDLGVLVVECLWTFTLVGCLRVLRGCLCIWVMLVCILGFWFIVVVCCLTIGFC